MNHPASDIRRQATRLLESAGISQAPVSLRDIVSALNLELVGKTRQPFTSEAALGPLSDGRATVPNGTGDSGRKRFTIAHEIGHFVLHPKRCRPEHDGGGEVGRREEREADTFAAELLMPEHLVRDAVREQGLDVARLADRFDVSRKAMQARLRHVDTAERLGDL